MKSYIVGIRHKESGSLRGLVLCDEPKFIINDIRATVKSTPNSAYAMFPSDYDIVIKEIEVDAFDSCVALCD